MNWDELDELGWIGVNWVNWGGRVNRGSTWVGGFGSKVYVWVIYWEKGERV